MRPSPGVVSHLEGRTVDRVTFDFGVELTLEGGVSITVETALTIASPDGASRSVDPGAPTDDDVVAIHRLLRSIVESAGIAPGATLVIRFQGGVVLEVPGDPHYEAWGLVAKTGERLVALPGGETAHWAPA